MTGFRPHRHSLTCIIAVICLTPALLYSPANEYDAGSVSTKNNEGVELMGGKQDYLDAYDRVFDTFKLNNEHYFKRTQILMIFIQSILFVALTKIVLIKPGEETILQLSLPLAGLLVSFIGFCAAWVWNTLVIRQHQLLEYCRWYMVWLENRLGDEGVPLAYFKHESLLFHHCAKTDQKYYKHCDPNSGKVSIFPRYKRKARCNLMGLESGIARFLIAFWIACVATFIGQAWICVSMPLVFIVVLLFC